MSLRDIIVVGASAGGVDALQKLAAGLPESFPAAIFVVLHIPSYAPSNLHTILDRAGPLPASCAVDHEEILPGHIYVAQTDHHLLVERERVRVTHGPKEHHFRPAIDPLFRSAAYVFGPRAIGVILTGALDDGTSGLWAIKDRDGIAIVQEPREAEYESMPQSALHYVKVDYRLPVAEIAPTLIRLTGERITEGVLPVSESLKLETQIAMEDNALRGGVMALGKLSPYTCPECHGVLVQLREGAITRFRCHTGHAFSINSLLSEVSESIEDSLWNTLRVIEENMMLLQQMAEYARDAQDDALAQRCTQKAQEAEQRGQRIRELVMGHETLSYEKLSDQL